MFAGVEVAHIASMLSEGVAVRAYGVLPMQMESLTEALHLQDINSILTSLSSQHYTHITTHTHTRTETTINCFLIYTLSTRVVMIISTMPLAAAVVNNYYCIYKSSVNVTEYFLDNLT